MTARALRVGVVLGGNLVEERLFCDGGPITVGQSLRCRLSVPADGVPAEHALFVRDQGRLMLRLGGSMTGRVAHAERIETELRGDVPLERGARGRVQIGDATILFQEIAAPAVTPRPQLPASVRGTFADRIDRRLATIVGASILLHAALGTWAWMGDVEDNALTAQAKNPEYRHETHVIASDMIETPTEVKEQPGAATPVAPVQTPAPIVRPARVAAQTPTAAPRLPTADDAERFAQMLTNDQTGPNGRNEISNRLPGNELGTQINEIRDRNQTVGNTEGGFRQGPRDGIGDRNEQVVNNAPANLEQQRPRTEREPGGRIDLRPEPRPPGGTPIPALILDKIRTAYMPGLMRCYKKGLVDDSSLGGKVKVAFTVTETGSTTDHSASGLERTVDACITAQMATWRFPVSKDKDGDPIDLDVALTLALVPST